MLSSDVQELEQPAKHIVGVSIRGSLSEIIENKLGNGLREQLLARQAEISDRVDEGIYLVQVYEYAPSGWTPDTPFTQVIGKQVATLGEVPEGMTSHTIPAGRFLAFRHVGPMRNIGDTYDSMRAWLTERQRGGPCPYDFEYWEDPTRLEEQDTEIGIHLPLLANGKVGS